MFCALAGFLKFSLQTGSFLRLPVARSVSTSAAFLMLTVAQLSSNTWASTANQSRHEIETGSALDAALISARKLELARHPLWLGLLHFDDGISQVESPEFFLAPGGRRDAEAELEADIRAFFAPASTSAKPDEHARCRFPARLMWLDKQLGFNLPAHTCKEFDYYALDGDIESISMVFVAGHFKSPASFFGHNLLKFNNSKTESEHLLEPTINYGAIVPNREAPLRYMAMGIFGGYKARFSRDQFFRLYQNYAERELRDIWEYPLNLEEDEIRLIVAHSWELTNMEITYYFFRENCAYQIASLLNVVMEEKLVPEKLPWSLPYNVFDKLSAAQRNGKPLVSGLKYFPSRKSRFEKKFLALDASNRRRARAYISGRDKAAALENIISSNADDIDQTVNMVDTLLDYYQYRIESSGEEKDKKIKTSLLLERLKLPIQTERKTEAITPALQRQAPHLGQKPTMLRTSFIYNTDTRSNLPRDTSMAGVELHLRPAYYDLLNLDPGRLAFSAFSLLDIRLSVFDDDLNLDAVRLVSGMNLNPSTIELTDDRKLAWMAGFGAENDSLACKGCMVPFFTLGFGRSTRVTRHLAVYGLAGGHLQSSLNQSGHIAGQLLTGITGKVTPWWSTHLQVGIRRYLDGSESERGLVNFENRFGNSRSWDIRFSVVKNIALESRFSVSAYF